jgi:hypothetical protein
MRIRWADQLPQGISVQSEEEVLTKIEELARQAGFDMARQVSLEDDLRSHADLVIETPQGLLIFEVRRKSSNDRARIDIETRPNDTYRTRHLLLRQIDQEPWELVNDSDLREGDVPATPDDLTTLVEKLFSKR